MPFALPDPRASQRRWWRQLDGDPRDRGGRPPAARLLREVHALARAARGLGGAAQLAAEHTARRDMVKIYLQHLQCAPVFTLSGYCTIRPYPIQLNVTSKMVKAAVERVQNIRK